MRFYLWTLRTDPLPAWHIVAAMNQRTKHDIKPDSFKSFRNANNMVLVRRSDQRHQGLNGAVLYCVTELPWTVSLPGGLEAIWVKTPKWLHAR